MNYTSKIEVYNTIGDLFSKCVIRPENPFSIDNPDFIVRENGKIYAVYIPTYEESLNTDHLLRRLYVSQLCYSTNLLTVLLLDNAQVLNEKKEIGLQRSFTHISYSLSDVVSYIKSGDQEDLRKWKQLHYCKQLNIFEYKCNLGFSIQQKKNSNLSFENLSIKDFSSANPVLSWRNIDKKFTTRTIARTQYGLLSSVEYRKNSFRDQFQSLMTYMMLSKYHWDDGAIYWNNECDGMLNLANTNWNLFEDHIYPNIYSKSLAFVGCVATKLSRDSLTQTLYDHYIIYKSRTK